MDHDAAAQLTIVAVFNIVIAVIRLQTANYKARGGQLHDLQALSLSSWSFRYATVAIWSVPMAEISYVTEL